MRDIGRLVLVLGLIGILSASALSYVRTSLAPRIEHQEDFYVRGPALARLFDQPAADLLANKLKVLVGGREYPVFFCREDGRVTGLAIEAAGHGGYGGDIVLMIGIDLVQHKILGVEIVSHSETPGVGAQVERASFRAQWEGLAVDQPVALRTAGGQIDAITGATFSSRAVVAGTNLVIEILREHATEILERAAAGQAEPGGST